MNANFIKIFIILSLIFTSSCGRKTPPEAPEDRAARPVSELKLEATKNSVVLSWKQPTQNVKGDDLIVIDSFIISKREYKLAQSNDFDTLTEIKVENKQLYSFVDNKVEVGKTYDYVVSTVNNEDVDGQIESFARVTFKGEQSTISISPYIEEVK